MVQSIQKLVNELISTPPLFKSPLNDAIIRKCNPKKTMNEQTKKAKEQKWANGWTRRYNLIGLNSDEVSRRTNTFI